jgi:pimeloyl-ACP methyl ester carboxylesterase
LVAIDGLGASVERYRGLATPPLLLTGSDSSQLPPKNATAAMHQVLQGSRVAVLTGQGHMANRLAPELVADSILGWFKL